MSKKIFLAFLVSWIIILTSYAISRSDPKNYFPSSEEKQINQIQDWKIKGSIGVRHDNKTDIASVSWVQSGKQTYIITLSGPLSLGASKIVGFPGHVILWKSKKEKYSAKTPEQLMQTRLGWHIPMSNMYYWVRGLPAPGLASQKNYDEMHHLRYLNQQGWDVEYLDYTSVNGIDLPRKIVLTYPNLSIKFVIKQWKLKY